jgi:hypothetical protein
MNRARLARAAGCLLPLALLVAAACGDGDDDDAGTLSGPAEDADAAVRPEVTFAAGGATIEVPGEVPSGFVDLRVKALEGEGGAHFLFARVNDGVSDDQLQAAIASPGDEFFELVNVVGGNGTIAAGDQTLMSLELPAGDYVAINIYFTGQTGPVPQFAVGRFTAVDEDNPATAPDDEGTIHLGPEMRITAPAGVDATGTWRFENRDPELIHEAAMVRLAPATTTDDLIAWSHAPAGPPPIEGEFGSMGAIGPGNEAWIDFDASPLEPGDYAIVCFIPGADGVPHLGQGMIAPVSVGEPGA